MLWGQCTSYLFFLIDHLQTLRHQYLVGPPNCRQVVGTAEYKPNSSETLCTLHFIHLTLAATFFFLLQRSLLLLLSFVLCVQGSAFPGEKQVLQEDRGQSMHQRASCAVQCHVQGAESQNEKKKPLPIGWRKDWAGPGTQSTEESVENEERNQEAEQMNQVWALGIAKMLGLCWLSVEMIPYLCNLGPPRLT